MIERALDIPTADGAMNAFVVHPEEGGPHPVVLFFMDAPGKRGELHDMARRIAAVGYFVVLPNLYYRDTREFRLQRDDAAAMAEMYRLMATLGPATAATDAAAMLDFVDGEAAAADGRRIAALGYCMSGPQVVWAAAAHPDRFRSIASIYGANMVTAAADSPHRCVERLRCEAYFACAETDRWAPPEAVAELEACLRSAGTTFRLELYPGTGHGFAFPKREGIYDRAAAERHWERLFALFGRTLGHAENRPMSTEFQRVTLFTDIDGRARFRADPLQLSDGTPASRLSALMPSGGYQLRMSPVGFASRFHCTGTPQWVLILGGRMEIGLQDGTFRVFGPGEHFYSADTLPAGATFDPELHGHCSRQLGDEPLTTLFVRD